MPAAQVPTIEPDYVLTMEELDRMNKQLFSKSSELFGQKQSVIDADYMRLIEWQDKPDLYMKEVLGFEPWTCPDADDQLDIVYAIHDHERVSVRSGNGAGKTGIAGRIANHFLYCYPPSIVITTAPTTRQVEKQLWGEIRSTYKFAKVPLGGELLNTELKVDEGWYAIGFSTDEPEKFQGFHAPHILIIVDEASGVVDPIFEAIEGVMTSANVRLLLIGNPTNAQSYFGRTHLHPREQKAWKKLHLSCWNTPNVRAGYNKIPSLCAFDWPQKKLEQWGEWNPFYQVRVLGEFPEVGEDNLVPYHLVHSALERTKGAHGRKVLSVDVARFGFDKSVISRLWGQQFRVLKKIHKQDGVYIANAVVEQLKHPENQDTDEIRVDVIGWGAGCFDELKRQKKHGTTESQELLEHIKLIPVNVSEKCRSKKARKDYFNIRAEAGMAVRGIFEEGEIDIDDEDLGVQLANIKYKFRDGRYLLEEKEKYKDRLKESPDELDTLLLAKAIARKQPPTVR